MTNDGIKVRGDLNIVLRGPDGKIKDERNVQNLVVTDGLNLICSRLKDATDSAPSHMGIGTGTTAAAAGDTALGTEASGGSYARQSVGTDTEHDQQVDSVSEHLRRGRGYWRDH